MILELLRKVCKSLEQLEIPYMVSGSLAMNTYTVPRMTRDLDIVVNLQVGDFEKFVGMFKEGFYLYEEGVKVEIEQRGMFNAIDYESGYKIDFIVRKDTEFHIHEFSRRKRTQTFGFEFWVVSLEDLILSKLKWIQVIQSEIQLNDIKNLLRNEAVDMDYLHFWIDKLNLKTFELI